MNGSSNINISTKQLINNATGKRVCDSDRTKLHNYFDKNDPIEDKTSINDKNSFLDKYKHTMNDSHISKIANPKAKKAQKSDKGKIGMPALNLDFLNSFKKNTQFLNEKIDQKKKSDESIEESEESNDDHWRKLSIKQVINSHIFSAQEKISKLIEETHYKQNQLKQNIKTHDDQIERYLFNKTSSTFLVI